LLLERGLHIARAMPSHYSRLQALVHPISKYYFRPGGMAPSSTVGGGFLRPRPQYYGSHCILPSNLAVTVTSRSGGFLFETNAVALWPPVTIRQNGFIGYAWASGLLSDRLRCKNLSLHSFYLGENRNSILTNYMGLQGDG